MRMRHLLVAAALTFGLGGAATATPLAATAASVETPGTVELARWKGRGKHYGWYRGRHRGWYGNPGRRYGWYKPRRRFY
jgi:hypothetical protein